MASPDAQKYSDVRFITSVYGHTYGGMLLCLLYSIAQSNPKARVTVFWQEVSEATQLLVDVFPRFEFIETSTTLSRDLIARIAEKSSLWVQAAAMYPDEKIVFVDVDMLVLKDIGHFFSEDFDIGFTHKPDEIYPINTGTILATMTPEVRAFFAAWAQETAAIARDPERLQRATSREYPYGAPDQMSFSEMISYERGKSDYAVEIHGATLSVRAFPCALLNETNSRAVDPDMHIIHYKAGWHQVLLRGKDFLFKRSKADSWEMYILYLSTYARAVDYASKQLGKHFEESFFGIVRPFYISRDFHERPWMYRIFHAKEKCIEPLRRFSGALMRRLGRVKNPLT